MDDQLFRLEMVPRMARTLQVKGAFVFSDNLDIRLPGRIASLLAEGKPTKTLRPSGMRFPYRLDFSCILFVETGRVDSVINTSSYRMNACSVLLVPSGAVLHSIEYQAGTRFLIIAWNSAQLFATMNSRSAHILRRAMVAPLHMPVSRERMSRYVQLLRITLHVASGGPEYYFQEDIIAGFAEMLSGGMAKMILEHQKAPEHTSRERFILDRFMDLVQKNCREHRDLAFYADALYLSPKYLSRIVSRVSGRRAVDLILENVISEAQLLLSQGELNVQQVSHMLNFPNPSYFGRYYLKATGETPLAFQRRKQ